MKKSLVLKIFTLVMLLCLSLASFTACLNVGAGLKVTFIVDDEVYTVIFANGQAGHGLPDEPKKEDCVFDGWYLDNGTFNNRYYGVVSDATLESLTVYGKWSNIPCGHNWSEWQYLSLPTCTEDGTRTCVCLTCGKLKNEVVSKLEHDLEHYEEKPATCTEDGHNAYNKCKHCDYTTYEKIEALGHTKATAVEENRVEATCEDDGSYDLVTYCSTCGEELNSEHKTITKLGHDYGEVSYVWNSDYTECTATRVCANDGNHKESETATVVKTVTQNKTCTLDELTTYTATFKNSAFATQTKENVKTADKLGHKEASAVEENRVEATCEDDGSYDSVVYCSTCGTKLSTEHKTITKLGHDYGEVSYVWNSDYIECTATRVCANDSTHKESETATVVKTVTQNKTCTLDELTTYTATFKNSAFATQTKENVKTADKLGHKEASAVEENRVEATCEDGGSYDLVVYCSTCGTKLSRESKTIEKLPHDFSDNADYCKNCNTPYFTEGLQYELVESSNGNYYKVVGKGTATGTRLVIPTTYNDLPVKEVAERAFYNWSDLFAAVIPDSVTSIGDSAFSGCSGLTSITIPDSVTSIGHYAFANCCRLVEVINKSNLNITKGSTANGWIAFYALNVKKEGSSDIVNVNDYLFITDESGINYLVDYVGNDTELVLPDNYNGQNYVINRYAFYECNSLQSITIPDSVTTIGSSAFGGCSSLQNIGIPDSVTTIGSYAFRNCSAITNVIIPDRVTSIGSEAFRYCGSLQIVKLGNSVTSIGQGAFYGCSSLTSITIPDSVTSIGGSSFYDCSSLQIVKLGNSVTSIGYGTFYNCSNLTNVTIPDSVTSIGKDAFCNCRSLTSITIGNGVTSVGQSAFIVCSSLKGVYISDIATWCNIEFSYSDSNPLSYADNLYLNNELVTDLVIPNTVTTIKDYAFQGATCLTSVKIPDRVTSIGKRAFYGCTSLTSVTIGSGVTSIGQDVFYDCSSLESVCITDIATWCNIEFNNSYSNPIYYAHNLYLNSELVTDFVIPSTITTIKSYNFYSATCLKSVTIPDSVTSIGDSAFSGCSGLTSITISNSVTLIGNGAFWGCNSLTSITIPDSVTSIGSSAFSACYKLVEVIDKSSLNIIKASDDNGYVAAYALTVKNEGTSDIVNVNDYLFYTYNNVNYLLGYDGTDTELVLPDKYNGQNYEIYKYAFYNHDKLTNITIPDSVTSIGEDAFYNCRSLTNITIPDSVTSIGAYAFYGCSNLTSVTIGNGVTSIGSYAFIDCHKLVEVINRSSLDINKGTSYFDNGCVGQYALNIKTDGTSDIVNVNDYLFYMYNNVNYLLGYVGNDTELLLPDNYNGQNYKIFRYAFYNCDNLTSITIPDSVTSIGYGAFRYCRNLTRINFKGTKEQWNVISKGSNWKSGAGEFTVYCTDGEISKEDT